MPKSAWTERLPDATHRRTTESIPRISSRWYSAGSDS
jgi:hypothetical protein